MTKNSLARDLFERDVVEIVETNVDDVTGEVLARTVDRLLKEGALDATVSSFLGKKGRMGQTVRVVCGKGSAEKYAQILVEETGTLGVKVSELKWLIVPRKIISISVEIGSYTGKVNVKVSKVGEDTMVKPELEDAKQISEKENIPLRKVLEIISSQARAQLAAS